MDSSGIKGKEIWAGDRQPSYRGSVSIDPVEITSRFFSSITENTARIHVDTMNQFVLKDLIQFLESQAKKGVKIHLPSGTGAARTTTTQFVKWNHVRIGRPLVTPHACRQMNRAYQFAVLVDLWQETYVGDWDEIPSSAEPVSRACAYKDFHFFSLPVLLGSAVDSVRDGYHQAWLYEANYDSGGHYLCESANSSERTMPFSIYLRWNHPYMLRQGKSCLAGAAETLTASKSYAAASVQYHKKRQDQENEDEEDEDAPKKNTGSSSSSSSSHHDVDLEIRCSHESRGGWYSTATMHLILTAHYAKKMEKKSHNLTILIQLLDQNKPVPFMTVLYALGWTWTLALTYLEQLFRLFGHASLYDTVEVKRILHYVHERFRNSKINSQKTALHALIKNSNKDESYAHTTLCHNLLPFLGLDVKTYDLKARYLVYLWWLAIMKLTRHITSVDDQDHDVNQRYESNAVALGSLLRRTLRFFLKHAENTLRRHYKTSSSSSSAKIHWHQVFNEAWLTKRIAWCMTSGIWSPTKHVKKNTRKNVTMALNRLNDAAYSSYLRRINTPIKPQDKSLKPRQLHISHYGRGDPETQEGENSGGIRMAAESFHVSLGSSSDVFWRAINGDRHMTWRFEDEQMVKVGSGTGLVLLNGVPKGWVEDAASFCRYVRNLRRDAKIHRQISISWTRDHQSIITILTEPGRSLRPLLCLERYEQYRFRVRTLEDLFALGIIETIDSLEERSLCIAYSERDLAQRRHHEVFTHCELDPAFMFGGTMNTPFVETTQSPRVTFHMNMARQAIAYRLYSPLRASVSSLGLYYGQEPVCGTRYLRDYDTNHGLNLIEGVGPGITEEDNMEFGRHLEQSGAFMGYSIRVYQAKECVAQGEKIERPETSLRKELRYAHLQDDGLCTIGATLKTGDAIIGRTVGNGTARRRDDSIEVRLNEEGQVIRHVVVGSRGNRRVRTYLLMKLRGADRGDKFTSRHGQKITVSIKRLVADMMFDEDTGQVFDALLTLVCLPSRMTVGQLHELEASATAISQGKSYVNARAFHTSKSFYEKQLVESKAHYRCYVNGRTGRAITQRLYAGLVFQEKIKHLVIDKEHARGIGPVVFLTRQPTEFRWQFSGLRLGEMERDCLVAHGAAHTALESFFGRSDPFHVSICVRCGIRGIANEKEHYFECLVCGRYDLGLKTQMAAGTKTFFDELATLGILARFEVNHRPEFRRNLRDLLDTSHIQRLYPSLEENSKQINEDIDLLLAACSISSSSSSDHQRTDSTTTTKTSTNKRKKSTLSQ